MVQQSVCFVALAALAMFAAVSVRAELLPDAHDHDNQGVSASGMDGDFRYAQSFATTSDGYIVDSATLSSGKGNAASGSHAVSIYDLEAGANPGDLVADIHAGAVADLPESPTDVMISDLNQTLTANQTPYISVRVEDLGAGEEMARGGRGGIIAAIPKPATMGLVVLFGGGVLAVRRIVKT